MSKDENNPKDWVSSIVKDLLLASCLIVGVFLIPQILNRSSIDSLLRKKRSEIRHLDYEEYENGDTVKIYIDLPGCDEKAVNLKASDNCLKVKTNGEEEWCNIVLPCAVVPETMQITKRNRVLEIKLQKKR